MVLGTLQRYLVYALLPCTPTNVNWDSFVLSFLSIYLPPSLYRTRTAGEHMAVLAPLTLYWMRSWPLLTSLKSAWCSTLDSVSDPPRMRKPSRSSRELTLWVWAELVRPENQTS